MARLKVLNKDGGTAPAPAGEDASFLAIAWFAELVQAIDKGRFRRAVEAQAELGRYGFEVGFRLPELARPVSR